MKRKAIKTGNSLALTIPSQLVDNWQILPGEEALVKFDHRRQRVIYEFSHRPKQMRLFSKIKKEEKE